MALAEARAAWQRTANRCLVQEDAKRAPILACCTTSIKQTDTGPTCGAGSQDTSSVPFNRTPSYTNLSPNSKWWLQMPSNYYACQQQQVFIDKQLNSSEGGMENCQVNESSPDLESLVHDPSENYATCNKNLDIISKQEELREYNNSRNCQEYLEPGVVVGSEGLKNENDKLYFDSQLSWTGTEKNVNTPWWRTADTEELALLVAQRSIDLIENCDLPMPQHTRVKKDLNGDLYCLDHDEAPNPLLKQTPKSGTQDNGTRVHTSADTSTVGSSCEEELRMSSVGQLVLVANKRLSPTHERMLEDHAFERGSSKGQLLEALRHSQTRAREAERAAQQAFEEKEHVLKLVFKQASQLFAYKQWLQLLQLENTYFRFKNNGNRSVSIFVPLELPCTLQKTRKTRRRGQKSSSRKRVKQSRTSYNIGRYAIVFALGLGLVGAGFLLGWTVGWMLPAL